jgi:hypothetical protein
MPLIQFRIGGLMLAVAAVAVACCAFIFDPASLGLLLLCLGPTIGAAHASRRSAGGLEDVVGGALLGAVLQAGVCVFVAPIAATAVVRPAGVVSVVWFSMNAFGFVLCSSLILSFLVALVVWAAFHAWSLAARLHAVQPWSVLPEAGGQASANRNDLGPGSAPRPPERVR